MIAVLGRIGADLLAAVDGVAASTGSARHSGVHTPSAALLAIGPPGDHRARGDPPLARSEHDDGRRGACGCSTHCGRDRGVEPRGLVPPTAPRWSGASCWRADDVCLTPGTRACGCSPSPTSPLASPDRRTADVGLGPRPWSDSGSPMPHPCARSDEIVVAILSMRRTALRRIETIRPVGYSRRVGSFLGGVSRQRALYVGPTSWPDGNLRLGATAA